VNYLVDTCVISEVVKRNPHPSVLAWLEQQDERNLHLSSLTIGEIIKGITRLPDSARRDRLRRWVEEELPARFEGRILNIDTGVAALWGVMQGRAEKHGGRLPVIDSLIAATADHHDLTVVTRNEKDLERCGVRVTNPWRIKVKYRKEDSGGDPRR
jgi:hypothetical protein